MLEGGEPFTKKRKNNKQKTSVGFSMSPTRHGEAERNPGRTPMVLPGAGN